MPLTKVQVISNALALLGKKPVVSLDGAGDLVVAAEQAFDFLFQSSLSKDQWRFASVIFPLSQIALPPQLMQNQGPVSVYYNYAYQLPADCANTIRLYPQNYQWEIFGNVILTNQNAPVSLEYVSNQVPIQSVPNYFWEYFVYEIATYLALSSAQEINYYQVLEPKRYYQFAQACAIDAAQRPQTPIQSAPMITNRYVTTWMAG